MKNNKQILIPMTLVVLDFFLVIGSFFISYFLRYGVNVPKASLDPFYETCYALAFIYTLALTFTRTFQRRFRSHWEVISKVFCGIVLGTLLSFVFLYVFRIKWSLFPSGVFLLLVPVGSMLISAGNLIVLRMTKSLKTRIVIVGGEINQEVLVNRSRVEIHRVNNIEEILNYNDIDDVMICKHIHDDSQLNLLIYLLTKIKVNVSFSPDLYAELLSKNIKKENSLRFLATSLGRKSDHEEFLVAFLDFSASVLLLFFAFPLMLVVSVLIKLTSIGPVFYGQKRVGKDGKLFTIYKFRTMVNDAEKSTGPVLASENDSRITRFGGFLRKARIDEMPQLFNVIRGQMSLVGPRPEREHFLEIHKSLRGIRLAVKPGITGLAQVKNAYDLHPKHKIKYDLLYIQRRCLRLNIYILLQTIQVVLSKKGR